MIPDIAGIGTNFKGAGAYYLHDKRVGAEAERFTAERVAWTETRNLATEDPRLAMRLMAATAMEQDNLKAEAGIPNTGRKSAKHVYCYSLAWHPDEAKELTREEMRAAVDETLDTLGARDHQALIVCHTDEAHPHVHVILNRVNPHDGRMLSNSKHKLKLSQWAEDYERRRGRIYCQERVENNAERARGRKRRARKAPEYHQQSDIREAAPANDQQANGRDTYEAVRAEQKARDAELAGRTQALREQHAREWREFSADYRARRQAIKDETEAEIRAAKARVKEQYREHWRTAGKQQARQRRQFEKREDSLTGKFYNAVETGMSAPDPGTHGRITRALKLTFSRHARAQALAVRQTAEKEKLSASQRAAVQRAIAPMKEERRRRLKAAGERFQEDRAVLIQRQDAEQARMRGEWRERNEARKQAFAPLKRQRGHEAYTRIERGRQRAAAARNKRRSRDRDSGNSRNLHTSFEQAGKQDNEEPSPTDSETGATRKRSGYGRQRRSRRRGPGRGGYEP
jgi:hypothetical protein